MFCSIVKGASKKLKFGTNFSITTKRTASTLTLSNLQNRNINIQKINSNVAATNRNRPVELTSPLLLRAKASPKNRFSFRSQSHAVIAFHIPKIFLFQ